MNTSFTLENIPVTIHKYTWYTILQDPEYYWLVGRGTPLYGLYGNMPLDVDRVWFLASQARARLVTAEFRFAIILRKNFVPLCKIQNSFKTRKCVLCLLS